MFISAVPEIITEPFYIELNITILFFCEKDAPKLVMIYLKIVGRLEIIEVNKVALSIAVEVSDTRKDMLYIDLQVKSLRYEP